MAPTVWDTNSKNWPSPHDSRHLLYPSCPPPHPLTLTPLPPHLSSPIFAPSLPLTRFPFSSFGPHHPHLPHLTLSTSLPLPSLSLLSTAHTWFSLTPSLASRDSGSSTIYSTRSTGAEIASPQSGYRSPRLPEGATIQATVPPHHSSPL